jgi:hypothetical protein
MELSVNSKNSIKTKNNNDNTIDSSFMGKETIKNHKFHNISMKKTKFLNKIKSNFVKNNTNIIKPKYLIKSKGLSKSINKKSSNNISKSNNILKDLSDGYVYGINTVRNTSINLDKIILNNNKSNNNINNVNTKNDKDVTNNNVKVLNKNGGDLSKKGLKSQIKLNLENKLKEHEEQRKRIQEELKNLEKQQYDLWMNFNDNMNSVDTTFNTNINSNQKLIIKSDLYNIDDVDNILNYNFI